MCVSLVPDGSGIGRSSLVPHASGIGRSSPPDKKKWVRVKKCQNMKVLRMRYSIVENVRTPCEIILIISRPPNYHIMKKLKIPDLYYFIYFPDFPVFYRCGIATL